MSSNEKKKIFNSEHETNFDRQQKRAILNPFCGFPDVRLLFILFVYSQMIINIYEIRARERERIFYVNQF